MSWEMVDEGWGNAARVWAYMAEPRFRPEYQAVLSLAGVNGPCAYLDIACGSGFAASLASERGATVHGIDASHRLLRIASARLPDADLRHGDMHDLPWGDETFDVATSFRGIWGNTPAAVMEAARVLRKGGLLALSFWPADLMELPSATIWASAVPESRHERAQMAGMGSIALDGRVEQMCLDAGLEPGTRHRVEFETEGATLDLEVEALLSSGPMYTAVKERGQEAVESSLRSALAEFSDDATGIRIPQAIEYLVAVKAGTG